MPTATPLTKAANGTTIEAKVGGPIHISLPGNPTTGYSWKNQESDSTHYSSVIEYEAPNSSAMGAPGTYKIVITPKEAGSHPVELVYTRSFEADKPPAETFKVTLNVS